MSPKNSGAASSGALLDADDPAAPGFSLTLANFSGPFDLLLSLIAKREMDITEVALSSVTDEFLSYLRGVDSEEELDRASEFLVVAATLLDLKVAGLLPQGELVDAEGVALLEARDLLFARLLQYRAFKHVALMFAELEAAAMRSYPRAVTLEDRFTELLPEVMLGVDADRFAQIAAAAFTPRLVPSLRVDHLHVQAVSVPEQAMKLMGLLENRGVGEWASFTDLVADCDGGMEIVGRFLALLELYRAKAVNFEQIEPLGVLQVSWTGERPTNEHLAAAVEEDQ
jgi:segregation and condensation protein A